MRGYLSAFLLIATAFRAGAVPIPADPKGEPLDRTNFLPRNKHLPLPGTIIALLAADAQPVLTLEGRLGPADQVCVGWNGGSYRWVYLPVETEPTITNLAVPL